MRVISHTLATLLANLGYEVSLLYDYDAAVRGGTSVAHLIYDAEPIANPVVGEADIMLKLSNKPKGLHARKTVGSTGLSSDEEIPFDRLGIEKFGKDIFGNMIALGHLMRLVGLEASEEEMSEALPLRYRDENLSAVLFGYHLKEEDLERGRHSKKRKAYDFASDDSEEMAADS